MANDVLRDIDPHFQCQTFYCDAFVIKNAQAGDVPYRFASTRTAFAVEFLLFYILVCFGTIQVYQ